VFPIAMMKIFQAVRTVDNQTEDRYFTRFMCYLVYDVALGVLFALVALTDYLTALVSAMYCVDALCLFWLTSCVKTQADLPALKRVTYLNLATNTVTLLAYVALRLRFLLASLDEGGGLGPFTSLRMPATLLGFAFIAGSKVVKLLAIDSFRTWLGIHHPAARQGFLVSLPEEAPRALSPVSEARIGADEAARSRVSVPISEPAFLTSVTEQQVV